MLICMQRAQNIKTIIRVIGFCVLLVLTPVTSFANSQPEPRRIIAIGDLHGDYEAYIEILGRAGLIDKKMRWSGETSILVQTGDIADRGPDSLKIIRHIRKLQNEAAEAGGQVIVLNGNHEAMNMTGDFRYVHPDEYKAFKSSKSKKIRNRVYAENKDAILAYYLETHPELTEKQIRKAWNAENPLGKFELQWAWSPDGEIGSWAVNNPIVAIIGDSLFVHGGLSPDHRHLSVESLNKRARAALNEQSTHEARIINDPHGPLWYRGLIPGRYENPEHPPEDQVEKVLDNYGVSRIIIGHTPSIKGVQESFDGRLIRIDTGAADYYGGTASFLRIENGEVFAHDGKEMRQIESGDR